MAAAMLRCVLSIWLVFMRGTIAVPISPTDNMTSLSTTLIGDPSTIDRRFSITAEYGRLAIPGIALLINAVNAMQDLALEDFEEPIVPISYLLKDYPEVVICPLAAAEGGAIQTRFVVWGLWSGIFAMLQKNVFRTAVFTLGWEGSTVGYLLITQPGAHIVSERDNTSESHTQRSKAIVASSSPERLYGTAANTQEDTTDKQLTVRFTPTGQSQRADDILITVLYGLFYAAYYPSAQEAKPMDLSLPSPYNTHLGIFGTKATHQTSEPALKYQWIIMTLARIPQYLLQRRRFSGVSFQMIVGDVDVGQGQLSKET